MTPGVGGEADDRPAISPDLLAILVCPVDKQELRLDGERLICTACGRIYPIEEGIPNMLVDEAS